MLAGNLYEFPAREFPIGIRLKKNNGCVAQCVVVSDLRPASLSCWVPIQQAPAVYTCELDQNEAPSDDISMFYVVLSGMFV